jgi:hypothetical protein
LLLQQGLKSRGSGVSNEDIQHAKRLVHLREHAAYGWRLAQVGLDYEDAPS